MEAVGKLLEQIEDKYAYLLERGVQPTHIVMSPITYSLLKEELGLKIFEDIEGYGSLKIAVTLDQEEYFEIV